MDHLFSRQSPPTTQRFVPTAVGGLLAAALLWRDVQRRRAGILRRSPAEILAAGLSLLGPWGRRIGGFLIRHHTTAYVALVVSLYLVFKYQQIVRRFLRRLLRDNPTPPDALSDFVGDVDMPGEVVGATASSLVAPSEAMRFLSEGDAVNDAAGALEGGARSFRADSGFDDESEDYNSAEIEAAYVAAFTACTAAQSSVVDVRAASSPRRSVASSPGGHPPLQPPSMAFLVQFLRMMRHTVQGISTRAVLALYARLERVSLRSGEVLFRAGTARVF